MKRKKEPKLKEKTKQNTMSWTFLFLTKQMILLEHKTKYSSH